jgi:hypothetical protein
MRQVQTPQIAAPAKRGSLHQWQCLKAHDLDKAHGYKTKLYRYEAEVIQIHENANVHNFGCD